MSQPIFCPLCQRKNNAEAKHCAFCGIKFVVNDLEIQTTNQISKQQSTILKEVSQADAYLSQLPEGAFALFIMDVDAPILFENLSQIIIGRHLEAGEMPVIDLADHGGVELGVSRRHLQITSNNGQYTVMDLGSTNGSWLNRQRLTPSKPYRLHHNDQLLLGQIRIFVCFHTDEASEKSDLKLQDRSLSASDQPFLSTSYLTDRVLPLIEAIDTVQQISALSQGREANKIYVEAIAVDELRPLVNVRLVGAATTIRLIEKWILPWRENNLPAGENGVAQSTGELAPKISQLALKLLADLVAQSAPASRKIDIKTHLADLVPPLKLLALGPLSIHRESRQETA